MTDSSTPALIDAAVTTLAREGFDRGLLAGYRRGLERHGLWHIASDAARFRSYIEVRARLEHLDQETA